MRDELFYSLLIYVHSLLCQPSCYNSSHLAIVFKFVVAKILSQRYCQGSRFYLSSAAMDQDFASALLPGVKIYLSATVSDQDLPQRYCQG